MTDWIDALASLSAAGARCVLVTVAQAEGSTPREAGAKMVVSADATAGTIGGGHLEHKAIEIARSYLELSVPAAPVLRRFPLGPSLCQCCGGRATLLFEPLRAFYG